MNSLPRGTIVGSVSVRMAGRHARWGMLLRRMTVAACFVGSTLVLGRWLWIVAPQTPDISRSDHLLAIWRVSGMIVSADLWGITGWIFEFGGGHIIAYARTLQLVNYFCCDYSGQFIKLAALGSFVAAWAALLFAS